MDNIVFLEPLPIDPASLLMKKENSSRNLQSSPDFLAEEVSTTRQMDVWFNSRSRDGNVLICYVVAGCLRNRKSFTSPEIKFQGLDIPLPVIDQVGEREKRATTPIRDIHRAPLDIRFGPHQSHESFENHHSYLGSE